MNLINLFIILSVVFILSYLLIGQVRVYALKRRMVDYPNYRSLHFAPTPRGGGISICISVTICMFVLWITNHELKNLGVSLGVGGLIIALVGWIDDHKDISRVMRAAIYFLVSVWAVYWLGGLDSLSYGTNVIQLGWFGNFIAVLGIAWLTNLYNFMDGSDALSGVQAMSVAAYAGIFFMILNHYDVSILCFVIVASSLGFIIWNWPPAKIFMGDAGSCYLGYAFGVLALYSEVNNIFSLLIWVILLAIFILDASLILLVRMYRGEKWYLAHCSHAYQKLVKMGLSKKALAISVLVINSLVLGPIALFALLNPDYLIILFIAVILSLSLIWFFIQYKSRGFNFEVQH